MSMEINRSDRDFKVNYAEQLREEQLEKVKKVRDEKVSDSVSTLCDEYISSEKSGRKPSGLYRLEQDENGSRKIVFDVVNKSENTDKKEPSKADSPKENQEGKQPEAKPEAPENSEETCIGNTDRVDREIKKLKEKKQQLEQQIRSASGEEEKVRELERKLIQVENELRQKDNDTYRKQNSSYTQVPGE